MGGKGRFARAAARSLGARMAVDRPFSARNASANGWPLARARL